MMEDGRDACAAASSLTCLRALGTSQSSEIGSTFTFAMKR